MGSIAPAACRALTGATGGYPISGGAGGCNRVQETSGLIDVIPTSRGGAVRGSAQGVSLAWVHATFFVRFMFY